MRVLLDTNIVLDYLGANQGFTEDADKVFDLAAKHKDIKLVSSSAITDILYVLRRAVKDRNLVREKYESFRKKIGILSVTERDIDTAFARDWKDFENAVQYTVAESNGVDCIITRNKGDFEEDVVHCYIPQESLEKKQKQKPTIFPKLLDSCIVLCVYSAHFHYLAKCDGGNRGGSCCPDFSSQQAKSAFCRGG